MPNSNCVKPRAAAQEVQTHQLPNATRPSPQIKEENEKSPDNDNGAAAIGIRKSDVYDWGVGSWEGPGGQENKCTSSLAQTWWSGTLRRRWRNTAGEIESKPTQGKTGLPQKATPRESPEARGRQARSHQTPYAVLCLGMGNWVLVMLKTMSTSAVFIGRRIITARRPYNTTALCSYTLRRLCARCINSFLIPRLVILKIGSLHDFIFNHFGLGQWPMIILGSSQTPDAIEHRSNFDPRVSPATRVVLVFVCCREAYNCSVHAQLGPRCQ